MKIIKGKTCRKKNKAVLLMLICMLLISSLTLSLIPAASAADATSAAGIITAGNLNVRSSASTSGSILSVLPYGSYVTLIWKTGDWYYAEYANGRYGYVSAKYIRYVYGTYAAKTFVSSGSLNIRSGAGESYSVTGTLPIGRTVLILSAGNGWNRILYDGTKTGYVSAQYLNSVMAWPVPASRKINQYFGTHQGLDIGAAVRGVTGDSVIAAMGGKVVYSGWLNGYGYVVYINSMYNGQPIQTRYGHLNSPPLVTAGQTVGIGQRIGYMGNTGTSTGVHLHFEVRIRNADTASIPNSDSRAVDPLSYTG
jgi:murein DD-endopeptidase MepM/ murein hydrolase activator NlpD